MLSISWVKASLIVFTHIVYLFWFIYCHHLLKEKYKIPSCGCQFAFFFCQIFLCVVWESIISPTNGCIVTFFIIMRFPSLLLPHHAVCFAQLSLLNSYTCIVSFHSSTFNLFIPLCWKCIFYRQPTQ